MADNVAVWLEAVELTKRYGGVLALDGASLKLHAGEVYGLVGANGAGKSTLVKCLTGMVQPTKGRVLVDGRPLPLGRWSLFEPGSRPCRRSSRWRRR